MISQSTMKLIIKITSFFGIISGKIKMLNTKFLAKLQIISFFYPFKKSNKLSKLNLSLKPGLPTKRFLPLSI